MKHDMSVEGTSSVKKTKIEILIELCLKGIDTKKVFSDRFDSSV